MKAILQNAMLGSHILLEHHPSIGNEFACLVVSNIGFWVKDEMNEENPMGIPKTLIFFERMLNENGVFEINKENGWGLRLHICELALKDLWLRIGRIRNQKFE
jgi:hypothetical protein